MAVGQSGELQGHSLHAPPRIPRGRPDLGGAQDERVLGKFHRVGVLDGHPPLGVVVGPARGHGWRQKSITKKQFMVGKKFNVATNLYSITGTAEASEHCEGGGGRGGGLTDVSCGYQIMLSLNI